MSKTMLKSEASKATKNEKSLDVTPQLSSQIHRSFGVNASQISFSESPEVKAKGARAIAQGNKVKFAPGEFSPSTHSGKVMIGHEVSHLVSQAKGQVPHSSVVHNSASMEAASDRAGTAFASGKSASQGSVSLSANSGAAPQMWGRSKKKSGSKENDYEHIAGGDFAGKEIASHSPFNMAGSRYESQAADMGGDMGYTHDEQLFEIRKKLEELKGDESLTLSQRKSESKYYSEKFAKVVREKQLAEERAQMAAKIAADSAAQGTPAAQDTPAKKKHWWSRRK